MRYKLRTLMIVLAILPALLAWPVMLLVLFFTNHPLTFLFP
jgi:hypothetical protein